MLKKIALGIFCLVCNTNFAANTLPVSLNLGLGAKLVGCAELKKHSLQPLVSLFTFVYPRKNFFVEGAYLAAFPRYSTRVSILEYITGFYARKASNSFNIISISGNIKVPEKSLPKTVASRVKPYIKLGWWTIRTFERDEDPSVPCNHTSSAGPMIGFHLHWTRRIDTALVVYIPWKRMDIAWRNQRNTMNDLDYFIHLHVTGKLI